MDRITYRLRIIALASWLGLWASALTAEEPKPQPQAAEPPAAQPSQPAAAQPSPEQPKPDQPSAEPPKAEPSKSEPPAAPPANAAPDKTAPDKAESDKAEPAKVEPPQPQAESPKPQEDYYELYKVLADTLDQVERNYVKDISRRELMEAAITGVLGKLDPYSSYISPDEISRFKSSVESQFGGIGIQITIDRDQLKVLSPLVGTPAYRAGLQAGDSIIEIEGKSTEGVNLDEAVRRLKGEAGTSVTLTVIPAGTAERKTLTVKREMIHIETVLGDRRAMGDAWDYLLDHQKRIGYIRLTAFSRDTAQDLKKALEQLKSLGMKGLIIDLRFNPGGLLTSAIEISDLFVTKGRIVSTSGRNTAERTWDAQEEGTYTGFPMAILVNRYSASASEILAACLQDHGRAVVVGERTWGKGSVQNVIELEDGRSALKLTTAAYKRPSGKNIHRFPNAKETDEWGVVPDSGFKLPLTDKEMRDLYRHRADRDVLAPKAKAASPAENTSAAETGAPASSASPSEATPAVKDAQPGATATPDKASPDKTDPAKADPSKAGADGGAEPKAAPPAFVDRQLQKAFDHLTAELVRAEATTAAAPR